MFASKWIAGFKREKRVRSRRVNTDTVAEQVRQVLQTADQKLILMVRN